MDDSEFTIAYALRLGCEAFADIQPGHQCRLCGKDIGTSSTHGALCTREGTGTDTRNERHYALNTELARVLKFLDPTTRITFEPSIVKHFHKQPHDWKKDGRRRGDLRVRTATAHYIIDTSVGLAAAASAPSAANKQAGVVARKLAKAKVVEYTGAFKNFRPHEIMPFCVEAEGTWDFAALDFMKARITDFFDNGDQSTPKSVVADRVFSRLAVALQRANGYGVLNWRYAEAGEGIYGSDFDTVHAALNSAVVSLANCDADLREVLEEGEGAVDGEAAGVGLAAT
jgi:hypothetical protein